MSTKLRECRPISQTHSVFFFLLLFRVDKKNINFNKATSTSFPTNKKDEEELFSIIFSKTKQLAGYVVYSVIPDLSWDKQILLGWERAPQRFKYTATTRL